MQAIGIKKFGSADQLTRVTIPKPHAQDLEVIVEIKAVSTNPVDTKIRSGSFPTGQQASSDRPVVLGYDASGVVTEVGHDVTRFKVGDEVMFSGSPTVPGTNAQYCAVDSRIVGRKPKSWSHEQAAAIPLAGLTAWEGLVDQLGVPLPPNLDSRYANSTKPQAGPNKKVLLVVSGAGGVGSMIVALARRALGFETVIATASRPETVEFSKKMGATHVISHKGDMAKQLQDLGFSGVDLIFNTGPTDETFPKLVPLMNVRGKMCCIQETEAGLKVGALMPKSLTFVYELMFTRPMQDSDLDLQGHALDILADLADQGVLPDRVTKTLKLSTDLAEAHKLQESGTMIGKIALVQDL